MNKLPEVWLRGPITGYAAELQPVVHAILQAQEEIHTLLTDFPSSLLWERPAGMASPAFHLQHIAGVIDRMVSYAKAQALSTEQFNYLKAEGKEDDSISIESLIEQFDLQISEFLTFLAKIDGSNLTDYRDVGRAKLPSTVGGLLFHAAEHTQRHFGQLLVTVRVLSKSNE